MTPDGQGALDVSLEDELEAAAPAVESEAKPRRQRAKAKPAAAAPIEVDEELVADAFAQAELRGTLADTRIGTAGVPADIMAYSRSPGMEVNSTAARALAAVGGKGDLLVIAVEPGRLQAATELAHRAFGLLEPEPAE